MRGEVMHVVDTLIGSALLKRVNLNDALYNSGALIKSLKAEALLALLVCRPCSVHSSWKMPVTYFTSRTRAID